MVAIFKDKQNLLYAVSVLELFFFHKVEELIKKHKEELLKKRYKFNVGIIMGEFRMRLYSFTVSNEPLSPMNLLK